MTSWLKISFLVIVRLIKEKEKKMGGRKEKERKEENDLLWFFPLTCGKKESMMGVDSITASVSPQTSVNFLRLNVRREEWKCGVNFISINPSLLVLKETIQLIHILSDPLCSADISLGTTSLLLQIYIQVVEFTYALGTLLLSFFQRKINFPN